MNENAQDHCTVGVIQSTCCRNVAWITLSNPRKHNAMSLLMWQTLREQLASFEEATDIRCVVIRGDGLRAFCAGADLGEKRDVDGEQAERDLQVALSGLAALRAFGKPLIAMVAGHCIGGGLSIALSCDIRIVSTGASFCVPAAKLGAAYEHGDVKCLVDVIGPANAKQMIFTAERVRSERALQIGLANEVVDDSRLESRVSEIANLIALNAPLTISAAKFAVASATFSMNDHDLADSQARSRTCLNSEDYAEGHKAFAEKRVPAFKGR